MKGESSTLSSDTRASDPRGPSRARWVIHVVLAAGGLIGVGWLIQRAELPALGLAIGRAAPWLPIVVLLEGLRVALDAFTTRALYGQYAPRVPLAMLLRVHLAAYPLNLLLPAGRAAGEALKALTLKSYVPTERAIATAIMNPALALLGGAVISVPCLVAAVRTWGTGAVTIAIGVQCMTALGLGMAILGAARFGPISAWTLTWSQRLGTSVAKTQDHIRALPLLPVGPLLLQTAGRVVLLGQLTVLIGASGGSPFTGLLATGVHLVGAAVGDIVPGQLGATDGAFAWAAPDLKMSPAHALAVPLLFHIVQCFWAAIGALSSLWLTPAPGSKDKENGN